MSDATTRYDWRADEAADRAQARPLVVRNGGRQVKTYGRAWSIERAMGDLLEACRQFVYDGRDLAVWSGEDLVAAVRQDRDRGPEILRFDVAR